MQPIQQAHRRAIDHWLRDGALELVFGVLLLGCAVLVSWQARQPGPAGGIALTMWVVFGTWLGRRWIARVKMRRSAREGYVSFRVPGDKRYPVVLVGLVLLVTASVAALGTPLAATLLTGGLLLGAMLVLWRSTRNRRLALMVLVTGLAWMQSLLRLDVYPRNVALMLGVVGLAFLIMAVRAKASGRAETVSASGDV
jgi:hypothetical protein